MAYVGVADIQSLYGITDVNTDFDLIETAIAAASQMIDKYTGRSFDVPGEATTRYYSSYYDDYRRAWVVPINDLMILTGLQVQTNTEDGGAFGTPLTIEEDFYLAPLNALADGMPYTELVGRGGSLPTRAGSLKIAAYWGWSSIPDLVVQACLIQAARFYKRKDAPFGVAGSPENGSELRLLNRLDPDVELLLRPLKRIWGAV